MFFFVCLFSDRQVICIVSELDTAINKPLTLHLAYQILASPLTWLPALSYATTFGYELAIDANLANVLYTLLKSPTFGQTKAGYVSVMWCHCFPYLINFLRLRAYTVSSTCFRAH